MTDNIDIRAGFVKKTEVTEIDELMTYVGKKSKVAIDSGQPFSIRNYRMGYGKTVEEKLLSNYGLVFQAGNAFFLMLLNTSN